MAADSLLVVATDVVRAANDKPQLQPMLNKIVALPEALGKAETLLADNGYFSAANVMACAVTEIAPLIAMGREAHHPSLDQRFAKAPPPPKDPTPLEAMAYRLQTSDGKNSMRSAGPYRNRYSASSSPCWASARSCCAGSTACAASEAL